MTSPAFPAPGEERAALNLLPPDGAGDRQGEGPHLSGDTRLLRAAGARSPTAQEDDSSGTQ